LAHYNPQFGSKGFTVLAVLFHNKLWYSDLRYPPEKGGDIDQQYFLDVTREVVRKDQYDNP
jgi:hypothetical protein